MLQHTATYLNILQRTAARYNMLQHAATRCNMLQHTAASPPQACAWLLLFEFRSTSPYYQNP